MPDPTPAPTMDAIQNMVSTTVTAALEKAQKQAQDTMIAARDQAQQEQAAAQAQAEAEATAAAQTQADPLRGVLDPYLQPIAQRAQLAAEGAIDAVLFYQGVPKAGKYKDQIEQAFKRLVQAGTPFTRQDIWNWFKGQNFDTFAKEHAEEQKAAAEAAAQAAAGLPGTARQEAVVVSDPYAASSDELDKALKGITF